MHTFVTQYFFNITVVGDIVTSKFTRVRIILWLLDVYTCNTIIDNKFQSKKYGKTFSGGLEVARCHVSMKL